VTIPLYSGFQKYSDLVCFINHSKYQILASNLYILYRLTGTCGNTIVNKSSIATIGSSKSH